MPLSTPTPRPPAPVVTPRQATSTTQTAPRLPLARVAAAVAAALVATSAPSFVTLTPPAHAENVRVEDVNEATLRAGLVAANDGAWTVAEAAFRTVLARNGPSPSVLSNLASVRLQQGKAAAALSDADAAVALAPDAPAVRVVRALAHEALAVDAQAKGDAQGTRSHLADALADTDAALAVDNTDFTALFDRGNILQRMERFDDAEAAYGAAADQAVGVIGYRARHAFLLYQNGKSAEAARELRGVVRRAPTYAEARAALAAVSWAAGDVGAAEAQLAAASSIDAGWGGKAAVDGTRWPPSLRDAYERLVEVR